MERLPQPQPAQPEVVQPRDRFVPSNGHGSMLLYSLLHLTGYDLPIDELKRFRQLHPRPPAIPSTLSSRHETTTGPLGQGLANAGAWRLAEKVLAQRFNRPGLQGRRPLHPHVFLGDGCLDGGHFRPRGLLLAGTSVGQAGVPV